MSPIYVPGKLTLRKGWQPMDPDAAAYITAVETADGQALEEKVKIAIDNFVLGCKADGLWNAIKASCILAGARTLDGALVPLVGAAPTNYNFVAGDYNRETGLVGDRATTYLDSNRANNADPQNDKHLAVYESSLGNVSAVLLGSTNVTGRSALVSFTGSGISGRINTLFSVDNVAETVGFVGATRSTSTTSTTRANRTSTSFNSTSQTPNSANLAVFSVTEGAAFSNARIAFYSIGEALDLALLDSRVTDLITAIGAAIP